MEELRRDKPSDQTLQPLSVDTPQYDTPKPPIPVHPLSSRLSRKIGIAILLCIIVVVLIYAILAVYPNDITNPFFTL